MTPGITICSRKSKENITPWKVATSSVSNRIHRTDVSCHSAANARTVPSTVPVMHIRAVRKSLSGFSDRHHRPDHLHLATHPPDLRSLEPNEIIVTELRTINEKFRPNVNVVVDSSSTSSRCRSCDRAPAYTQVFSSNDHSISIIMQTVKKVVSIMRTEATASR
ncbi:hypothetical protein V6N13_091952 [Hibiscus sabdariffa]